jgi:hypothetical protein
MTIKLNNLDRWTRLPADKAIGFAGGADRRVRVHFNVDAPTALRTLQEDGEDRFLTVIPVGLSTLEFYYGGAFSVYPSDANEVWYQTAEDEPTFFENLDPVIFTKIMQRRARNPELERMFRLMRRNEDARFARLSSEMDARLQEAVAAASAAPAPVVPSPAPKKGKSNVPSGKAVEPVLPPVSEQDGVDDDTAAPKGGPAG